MKIAEYVEKYAPTNPDKVFVEDGFACCEREGKIIVKHPVSEFRPEYLATLEVRS